MSKKEMSRKLTNIGVMSLTIMAICSLIICIGTVMSLCGYECLTLIIVGVALWLTSFLTFYVIEYDNEEDI